MSEFTVKDSSPSKTFMNISFENDSKLYLSGELIKGDIGFNVVKKNIQILSLNLVSEFYYMKNGEEIREVIFIEASILDLKGAGDGDRAPFSLLIRPNGPTSLATRIGGISYKVVANLIYKEGGTLNQNNSLKNIEIVEFVSVNNPKQVEKSQVIVRDSIVEPNLWCCGFGCITAEISLINQFAICGEAIIINASVDNRTSQHIRMTSVYLCQTLIRVLDGRKLKNQLTIKQRGSVLSNKRQIWLSEEIRIPTCPPTACDLHFNVYYKIVLELQKSNGNILKLSVPVNIGNMPHDNDAFHSVEFKCLNDPQVKEFQPSYLCYL